MLSFANLFSQASDTTEKLIHIQLLSSKEAYLLVQKKWYVGNDSLSLSNLRYELKLKYSNNDGKTYKFCNLDSVTSVLNGNLSTDNLNIHFVNKSLGFIYGYSAVYAFYPVLFRTEDAGQSWQTIFAGPVGTPFRRSDFFMFDETKGIIVNNWGSEPYFNYKLTKDGGKTWKQYSFKLSRDDIRILNEDGYQNQIYSEDGKVTVIFTNPDNGYRGSGKVLVIQSTDYGKTFKELK
jgi:hypothetical protein